MRAVSRNQTDSLAEDANIEEMIIHNLTLPKINKQLVRGPFYLGARRTTHGRPGPVTTDEQSSGRARRYQGVMSGNWYSGQFIKTRLRPGLNPDEDYESECVT
jgi:hypothetical protein